MKTTRSRSHWAAMATLGLLTIVGCKVATPVSTQPGAQGAAGNGIALAAGATAAAPGKPGAAASGSTATASAGTGATNTATSGAAGNAAAGLQGASAASGAGAVTGAAGAPAKPKNPNAIPACEAKNNEGACDGAKLYYCIDEAPDGMGESCMSAALCQVGIKSGKCGVCEPGKFKCMETALQKCDENGQWKLEAMCASAALCKESKGICDMNICEAGEYKCSDADELQVCKADLTDFMVEKPCPKGLCNAEGKKCNECDPMIEKVCGSSSSLTLCSKDGMKSMMDCPPDKKYCVAEKKECFECVTNADCGMSTNECGTRACKDNKCVDGDPKPLKTPCSAGVCDLFGSCVTCVTDDDCKNPQLRCLTAVGCINKNALEATPLLGGYTVDITPGYTISVHSELGITNTGCSGINCTIVSKPATQTILVNAQGDFTACPDLFAPLSGDSIQLKFGQISDAGIGCDPAGRFLTIALSATAAK